MRNVDIAIVATVVAAAVGTGCSGQAAEQMETAVERATCTSLETRSPTASGQSPVRAGQTRACGMAPSETFDVTEVATGLARPWSVEPLPDGDFVVTEKAGRMRIVSAAGALGAPIEGIPPVDARGQGGLLDAALSPSFETDRMIYWSYAEPRSGGNGTSVARGVLSADRARLDQVQVIFRVQPTYAGAMHYGSRLAFGPDGMLYVTFGDRSDAPMRPYAQRMDSHLGKTIRIRPDGSVPPDNPFVGQSGALPEIWTVGHRNVQAAAFDADGRLWGIEHGTNGGDELNLLEKGKNYGWPLVAYGVEYSGAPIAGAVTHRDGFEDPDYYWDPVIAPSGAQFYSGSAFPSWRGNLFIGALKEMRLVRVRIENGRVTGEQHLLVDRRQRIRDVRQGPDGALYLVTDEDNGELLRVAPRR